MANTNKAHKKMNLFDVVVILLVLSLIATVIYRIYSGIDVGFTKTDSQYVVEFECDSEYSSLLNYVKEGDSVYFVSNGDLFGYIYASYNDERGAFYEIIDDIPTYAEEILESDSDVADTEEAADEALADYAFPTRLYDTVKIGGKIRLSGDAFKVRTGGYYTIGDINITKGSVISVYTENAEFTVTVKDITIIE